MYIHTIKLYVYIYICIYIYISWNHYIMYPNLPGCYRISICICQAARIGSARLWQTTADGPVLNLAVLQLRSSWNWPPIGDEKFSQHVNATWVFPKNRGVKTPSTDGENYGKPYVLMDDLGPKHPPRNLVNHPVRFAPQKSPKPLGKVGCRGALSSTCFGCFCKNPSSHSAVLKGPIVLMFIEPWNQYQWQPMAPQGAFGLISSLGFA